MMQGTFKLDFISDIHADWYEANDHVVPKIEKLVNTQYSTYDTKSTTLLIAGDISDNWKFNIDYLKDCKNYYKNVLYVDGNHDTYSNQTVSEVVSNTYEEIKKIPGVYYLNFQDFEYSNGVIIGCNGWYDFKFTENLTDPKRVEEMFWKIPTRDAQHNNFDASKGPAYFADLDTERLEKRIKYHKDRKLTVVTHTPPHPKSITWPWEAGKQHIYDLSGAFGNSGMTKLLNTYNKSISYWIHGHNHVAQDYNYNGTRIISNPRGYPWEGSEKCYIKSIYI